MAITLPFILAPAFPDRQDDRRTGDGGRKRGKEGEVIGERRTEKGRRGEEVGER